MCSTWEPAVLGEIVSRSAISLLERPCASSLSTSTSRGVRPAGPSRRRGTRWPAAAQRAALVEDRVGYAEPAEVVDEPGAAKFPDVGGGHARQLAGGGGELRD